MEATAGEKQAALTAWVEEKQADIKALANDPATIQQTSLLTANPLHSSSANLIHSRLIEEFEPRILSHEFLVIMLLDPQTGKVLVATDPSEEGKPRDDRPYFLEGKKAAYLTPIYFSPELQAPAMTASAPLFSGDRHLLGVLAGRINLDELNTIIQRRWGAHQTDESFLVNASHEFITQPRFLSDPAVLQQGIYTTPVQLCLEHNRGTIFATDYRDVPVIAAYRWLPERQMCLIVKISQAEALALEHAFAKRISWISIAALLTASIVAIGLSHTLIHPIRDMQTAAQRYGKGDMTIRLSDMRHDELGLLAKEFNLMAASLAKKEDQLRLHSFTLEKQIEARTAELQQSQIRFQALIENAPDGIALLGLDGKLRQVTPSTLQILGYTLEDAQGQDPGLLTHPDDLPYVLGILNDLIQNPGKVIRAEYRFLHKDRSWRWLESTISNLIAEPGVEAIVFNYRDISERVQAEETLRESEDRYRDIVEHIHDLIGTHDLQGNILSINPIATELLGISMDVLLTMNMRDLLVPDVRDQFDDYLINIQKDGQASRLMLVQTKNGQRRIWEYNNTLRKDSINGPVVRAHARDITERKQAEHAVREKERLLSEAQHIGRIGSLSYDIQRDTFQFSDEMYHLLDVSPEKFQHNSKDFMVLIYPSDRPQVANWITDLKAGRQIKKLDFRIFRQNGELRYLHCKGAVEFDSKGAPGRFIGTMQDVTERKIAEIQINQQVKRLTALSEIDRAIISGFDQHQTFDVILSQTVSQLQVEAADILLLDPDGRMLSYTAGPGFRTSLIETCHVLMGESYAGRVAKERRLIQVLDLRDRSHPPHITTLIAEEGFISYIAVPLIVKGMVKGVLEVFHRVPLQPYPEWLDFLNMLAGQSAIAIENATLLGNLQISNQELSQAYDATIEGWSHAMDLRDRETEGHTQRVTALTLEVARAMGMDEARLIHIRRGALLHDIGKLGIPDSILFKQGELTIEEWEIMQRHPEHAYEMLSSIQYLKPALPIPYLHHEKWDGTGYPLGLRGEQIPLEARIFAVIDVWDALRSDRPYRKAWTVEKTLEHIRSLAGSHFDPRVVDCFIGIVNSDFNSDSNLYS